MVAEFRADGADILFLVAAAELDEAYGRGKGIAEEKLKRGVEGLGGG